MKRDLSPAEVRHVCGAQRCFRDPESLAAKCSLRQSLAPPPKANQQSQPRLLWASLLCRYDDTTCGDFADPKAEPQLRALLDESVAVYCCPAAATATAGTRRLDGEGDRVLKPEKLFCWLLGRILRCPFQQKATFCIRRGLAVSSTACGLGVCSSRLTVDLKAMSSP